MRHESLLIPRSAPRPGPGQRADNRGARDWGSSTPGMLWPTTLATAEVRWRVRGVGEERFRRRTRSLVGFRLRFVTDRTPDGNGPVVGWGLHGSTVGRGSGTPLPAQGYCGRRLPVQF